MQRLMRATVVVLLVGTLVLYPLLAPPPHRIDEAHFQLITAGMIEAKMEAIFGVPGGVTAPRTDARSSEFGGTTAETPRTDAELAPRSRTPIRRAGRKAAGLPTRRPCGTRRRDSLRNSHNVPPGFPERMG